MKTRWLFALAFCVLVLSLLTPGARRTWNSFMASHAPLSRSTVTTTAPPPAYIRSLRPTYPYSVIPGGAYTPQELRNANAKDSIVRAHYADFNMKDAWVVKLTDDRLAYVSYRVQDRIYWTAKKLRIPQGEYLLTDGVHFARARCGNRLAEQPQQQISSLEPPAALLSLPAFRPNFSPQLDLGQTSPLEIAPPVDGLTPFTAPNSTSTVVLQQSPGLLASNPSVPVGPVPPFLGGTSGTPGPPPNQPPTPPAVPSPVPEPASIYLFLITFVVVLFVLTRVMRKEEKRNTE